MWSSGKCTSFQDLCSEGKLPNHWCSHSYYKLWGFLGRVGCILAGFGHQCAWHPLLISCCVNTKAFFRPEVFILCQRRSETKSLVEFKSRQSLCSKKLKNEASVPTFLWLECFMFSQTAVYMFRLFLKQLLNRAKFFMAFQCCTGYKMLHTQVNPICD